MKVWCVFFKEHDGCMELKAVFHSQDKAIKFAIEYDGGGNSPIEYFVEMKWVR